MCTNTQRWGSVCVCLRKVHAVFVRGFQCAGSCGKCQNRQQTAERTTTKTTPAAVPIRSEAINPGTSGNSDRSLLLLLATTSTVRARHYTYYLLACVCVCVLRPYRSLRHNNRTSQHQLRGNNMLPWMRVQSRRRSMKSWSSRR